MQHARRISTFFRLLVSMSLVLLPVFPAGAQWNPAAGQWLKSDSRDLRVMTWNVQDGICSTNNKVEGFNDWCALARIVAAMQPDVLVMQEAGDNAGEGTGSGVDSVATLTTTIGLFLHGGNDPFKGNAAVTAYVQKYASAYDLPYIHVSSITDNFNRNFVLSRYPFVDLTGDGRSSIDNWAMAAAAYAPGGSAGIRGFIWAEIDLPDASYSGNVVIGTAHLKAGSTSTDLSDRLAASKNIAYFLDAMFNGLGGGSPDPSTVIFDSPAATSILSPTTPAIWAGDFNEDEDTNGRDGPVLWMTRAQTASPGCTDGTDRDRTDSATDGALEFFTSARGTIGTGTTKFDYVCYQDSIATRRRAIVFNSGATPGGSQPPQLVGFVPSPANATSTASDHKPVIADFILPSPATPGAFSLSTPADGSISQPLQPTLTWSGAPAATSYTVKIAGNPALTSPIHTAPGLTVTSYTVPASVLSTCTTYYWGVTAVNAFGSTLSTPVSFAFDTFYPADYNHDGFVDGIDADQFNNDFESTDPVQQMNADFNGDGFVDGIDYDDFNNHFEAGC